MKLIVFTPSANIENEYYFLSRMFDMGLSTLHVRKPKLSKEKLKKYLDEFSASERKKIILHTHHNLIWHYDLKGIHVSKKRWKKRISFFFIKTLLRLRRGNFPIATSCKSLSALDDAYEYFDFILLSPVFTNPHGHVSSFNLGTLKRILPSYPKKVIARGGANLEAIEKAKEIGFAGIAFQRYIWNDPEPIVAFQRVLDRFKELELVAE